MNLRTGIVGEADGWKAILHQEGVPHTVVQGPETGADAFAVIVVNDAADDRELGVVHQFLRGGGSVLCSAKMFATIKGSTYDKKRIEFVRSDTSSVFSGVGLVFAPVDGSVAWNANELPCQDGSPTAFVGGYEGGHVIALPFDPSLLIGRYEAVRRSFYSAAKRLPYELVSEVDKNGVRRIVRAALQKLYALRDLPYVHVWHYPEGAPTAFVLRIDTDYSSLGDIEHLYELLRGHRVPGSWFVDVKSQEGVLWRYAQMQGQEVGIHCYDHKTYDEPTKNHANILRARERFRDFKLGAVGFAAPYGKWNPGLGKVIKEFRFEYSSEFSWSYDDLPCEPWIDTKTRGVVQVPVHPISIGTLRRQGYTSDMMTEYFTRVIDQKLGQSEPLFFYHHPKDRHHDVLETIMSRSVEAGAHVLTMGEYASWWSGRRSEGMHVELRDGNLVLDPATIPNGYHLRIVAHNGKAAIISPDTTVDLDAQVWKWMPKTPEIPEDISRITEFNPRIPITRAVDMLFSFRKKI